MMDRTEGTKSRDQRGPFPPGSTNSARARRFPRNLGGLDASTKVESPTPSEEQSERGRRGIGALRSSEEAGELTRRILRSEGGAGTRNRSRER